jgi:hypothetical protein
MALMDFLTHRPAESKLLIRHMIMHPIGVDLCRSVVVKVNLTFVRIRWQTHVMG